MSLPEARICQNDCDRRYESTDAQYREVRVFLSEDEGYEIAKKVGNGCLGICRRIDKAGIELPYGSVRNVEHPELGNAIAIMRPQPKGPWSSEWSKVEFLQVP